VKSIGQTLKLLITAMTLTLSSPSFAEIIEENGSLKEFFAGNEDNCAYDNYISHISEGIAREGYNDYGPAEFDRQMNGFGTYQIVDSLQNPNDVLGSWYRIFANIISGDIDTASMVLDSSAFSDLYDIVRLHDGGKNYILVREVLNNDYFDDNGTESEADDVRGSFRYGWGLFIFNPEPESPNIVFEVPHPCDDFIAPHIAMDAFLRLGARALFVTGAGREVKWSGVGAYDNSRSWSDPTRIGNRSAFNEAHKVVVDSIRKELVIPVHSYDSNGRDLAQILIACYPDNRPGLPILDWMNHYDILHLTPLYPVPANSIGNAEHPAVRIDEFYAIWDDQNATFYNYEYRISNNLGSLVGWPSPQRAYSTEHPDTGNTAENYMHIEHDEFPDMINEAFLDFYPVEGVPTWQTFDNIVEFTRPLYDAVYAYYHRPRFNYVPDHFATIQEAINGSLGGDTIHVRPGLYNESINFKHKNITLASLFMPTNESWYIDSTIIEGVDNSVVTFAGYEQPPARLSGFTLRGGTGLDGAGVFMTDASPVIDHCVIADNHAGGFGGGIFCGNSRPLISNCTITRNSSSEAGGGIFGWNNSIVALFNTIVSDNQPDLIHFFRLGTRNRIVLDYSDVVGGPDAIVRENNVEIAWSATNITQNPRLIDPQNGNFHLSPFSPCVDAGWPLSPYDPDSTIADMGALPTRFRNIVANPRVIEFASYEIGVLDSLHLNIYNLGIDTIRLEPRLISPEGSPFSIGGVNEAFDLFPDSTLMVWVVFTPQDSGEHVASLMIPSDQPGEEMTRVTVRSVQLGVGDRELVALEGYRLFDAYPNPFNSSITIKFAVGAQGLAPLRLAIYDLSGREVAELLDGRGVLQYAPTAGQHKVVWNAAGMPSGIYFCRMEAQGFSRSMKMLLVR